MNNILVVDIGNTGTTIALARGEEIVKTDVVPSHGTGSLEIRKALSGLAGKTAIKGSVLCSVAPSVNPVWLKTLKSISGKPPLTVNSKTAAGVRIEYPDPESIGADRIANACGAPVKYGAPVIVADFGTALTFDVVSKAGAYIGGVIVPGLPFMTDYLAERTELLPRIRLEGSFGAVGKSTEEAMRLGAKIGYRGIVREIVRYLRQELRMKNARLVATGGYAGWALEGSGMEFTVDPDLTVYGLARIYKLNAD